MIYKPRSTVTFPLEYGRMGSSDSSTCDTKCPECQQVMARTITRHGTHTWKVDAPGVEIMCRNCESHWVVQRVMIVLEKIK